ncbi:hypothetical protein P2318_24385 [Myxococcaceae bacterium GXIMD 01537]
MTAPTITLENAPRLTRLRELGAKQALWGLRGQYLAFDAQGRYLVSMAQGLSGGFQWWAVGEDARAPRVRHYMKRGEAGGFLPDGETVVSLSVKGCLQAWSAATGDLLHEACLDEWPRGLALAPNGEYLLVTSHEGKALLWNARTWRPVRELESAAVPLGRCAFSSDGRLAVAGTEPTRDHKVPGAVRFWAVATGAPLASVSLEEGYVSAVAFDPTGGLLAAGTSAGRVYLLDVMTQRVRRSFRGPGPGVRNLSFSPDGALLAVGGGMGCFLVMRARDGEWLYHHGDENDIQASSAVFSPDGKYIAWGQGDGTVGLWGVGA